MQTFISSISTLMTKYLKLLPLKKKLTTSSQRSPRALIALKLHAISQQSRTRSEQDWQDIFGIIRAQNLSLDDPNFSDTVLKYGGESAMQRIKGEISP